MSNLIICSCVAAYTNQSMVCKGARVDREEFVELEGLPPLNVSVRHFSIMNSLLTVLNSTEAGDPENVLAQYFLEHFDHLRDLNVYDVAEECYTSRSGIRRFCQSIGIDNFSALKASDYEWELHRKFFVGYTDHSDFEKHLSGSICEMMQSINEHIDGEDLLALATLIHDAEEVMLVTSDFSSMAVREFQQSMLYMHKIVQILTDSFGSEKGLEELSQKSLVIVISASGNYARAARRQLEQTKACLVLVTLSHDAALAEPYDAVLHLSSDDYYGKRTVYAKYGINYFFDLLYNRYFVLFGTEA